MTEIPGQPLLTSTSEHERRLRAAIRIEELFRTGRPVTVEGLLRVCFEESLFPAQSQDFAEKVVSDPGSAEAVIDRLSEQYREVLDANISLRPQQEKIRRRAFLVTGATLATAWLTTAVARSGYQATEVEVGKLYAETAQAWTNHTHEIRNGIARFKTENGQFLSEYGQGLNQAFDQMLQRIGQDLDIVNNPVDSLKEAANRAWDAVGGLIDFLYTSGVITADMAKKMVASLIALFRTIEQQLLGLAADLGRILSPGHLAEHRDELLKNVYYGTLRTLYEDLRTLGGLIPKKTN